MIYVCVRRSSEPCCGVICGLLCLCFCAGDGAITKTLSAWPVITKSACGEVVASERPAHFNNCYYYPESTTEWEREEDVDLEHAIVGLKWRRTFVKWRDESRCVIDNLIAAQITVGMVEVKPRLVHQACQGLARRVIRGPNPDLTTWLQSSNSRQQQASHGILKETLASVKPAKPSTAPRSGCTGTRESLPLTGTQRTGQTRPHKPHFGY